MKKYYLYYTTINITLLTFKFLLIMKILILPFIFFILSICFFYTFYTIFYPIIEPFSWSGFFVKSIWEVWLYGWILPIIIKSVPYLFYFSILIPVFLSWFFLINIILSIIKVSKINSHPSYAIAKIVNMGYSNIKVNHLRLIHLFIELEWKTIKIPNNSANTVFNLKIWDSVYVKYEMNNPNNVILISEQEYKSR